jgi:hypothetical protein
MAQQFSQEIASKRMNIKAVRQNPYYQHYVDRGISDKQLANKLQWIKKKNPQ